MRRFDRQPPGGRDSGNPPQDNRTNDLEHQTERKDSRPVVEWEEDRVSIKERKRRMREKAQELGIFEGMQAMTHMVAAVEGFADVQQIYMGPTKELLDEKARHFKSRYAVEQAWHNVKDVYATFDLPDAEASSDWLRLFGVFKAAIRPGDDIPGMLHQDHPSQREAFEQWCKEHFVRASTLQKTAQDLIEKNGLNSGAKIEEYIEKILTTPTSKLDAVVVAGFNDPKDLYIEHYGSLIPFEQAKLQLDGEFVYSRGKEYDTRIDEAIANSQSEAGRELRRNAIYDPVARKWRVMESPEQRARDADDRFARAERSPFGEDRSSFSKRPSSAMLAFDRLYAIVKEEVEPVIRKEIYGDEVQLEVASSSVAEVRMPTAAIVTAISHRENPRHRDGHREPQIRNIAHGIHGIPADLLKMLVDESDIHERAYALTFRNGKVVTPYESHLFSESGPSVGKRYEDARSDEAVKLFAGILVRRAFDLSNTKPGESRSALEFLQTNTQFAEKRLSFLQRLAHPRVEQGRDEKFPLESWYEQRLHALGNATTLEEVREHEAELTLTIYTASDDPAEQRRLAELDAAYPEKVRIGSVSYEVRYTIPQGAERPIAAQIEPARYIHDEYKVQILAWTDADIPVVGEEGHMLTISFDVPEDGFSGARKRISDLAELKDVIDKDLPKRAWETSEWKAYREPLDVGGGWPKEIVPQRELTPYAVDHRGNAYLPVPYVVRDSSGQHHIQFSDDAFRANLATARTRQAYEEGIAADARTLLLTEQGPALEKEAREKFAALTAVSETETQHPVLAYLGMRKNRTLTLTGLTRGRVEAFIANGEPDRALRSLRHIEEEREAIQELIQLFQEIQVKCDRIIALQGYLGYLQFPREAASVDLRDVLINSGSIDSIRVQRPEDRRPLPTIGHLKIIDQYLTEKIADLEAKQRKV